MSAPVPLPSASTPPVPEALPTSLRCARCGAWTYKTDGHVCVLPKVITPGGLPEYVRRSVAEAQDVITSRPAHLSAEQMIDTEIMYQPSRAALLWLAEERQRLANRLDARERENTELKERLELSEFACRHNGDYMNELEAARVSATARAEQAERERANLRGYLRWCAARGGAEPVTYGSRLPECVGGLAYYTIAPPSGCTVGPARTFEEALDAAVERYIASRGSADHA